jgi:GNAT superfamily N-acetyltransferase
MRESPSEAWARCLPYIQAALAHSGGTHTIEDVVDGIEDGRFRFWPGGRSAAVTQTWDEPRLRTLNIWLAGGDLRELRAMGVAIEEWARSHGYGRVVAGGLSHKRGWLRVAAALGFESRWTTYAKDLT